MDRRSILVSSRVRYGLAIGWAAVVLLTSVLEPPVEGTAPNGPLGLVGLDKWGHAGGYAVLALVVAYARLVRSGRELVAVAAVTIGYGAAVEALQAATPARAFEVGDLLANAVGAVLAVAGWWLAVRSGVVHDPTVDGAE